MQYLCRHITTISHFWNNTALEKGILVCSLVHKHVAIHYLSYRSNVYWIYHQLRLWWCFVKTTPTTHDVAGSSETPPTWVVELNTKCNWLQNIPAAPWYMEGKTTVISGKSHSDDAIVNKVLDSCISTLTKKLPTQMDSLAWIIWFFYILFGLGFIFYQWYPQNSCPVNLFDIQLCHWKRNCTYFQMAGN